MMGRVGGKEEGNLENKQTKKKSSNRDVYNQGGGVAYPLFMVEEKVSFFRKQFFFPFFEVLSFT